MSKLIGEGVNFPASVPVTVISEIESVALPVSLILKVDEAVEPSVPLKLMVLPDVGFES
jgi:hypothetical protein